MGKKKPQEPLASRTAAGHTQQQAADALGIPVRTWQDWEYRYTIPAHALRLYRHLAGIERIAFNSVK